MDDDDVWFGQVPAVGANAAKQWSTLLLRVPLWLPCAGK
jgi:hypothetical protein